MLTHRRRPAPYRVALAAGLHPHRTRRLDVRHLDPARLRAGAPRPHQAVPGLRLRLARLLPSHGFILAMLLATLVNRWAAGLPDRTQPVIVADALILLAIVTLAAGGNRD